MYIARDSDDSLWMYDKEPVKNIYSGMWTSTSTSNNTPLNDNGEIHEICKDVKWTDEKATEVEIIIKRR